MEAVLKPKNNKHGHENDRSTLRPKAVTLISFIARTRSNLEEIDIISTTHHIRYDSALAMIITVTIVSVQSDYDAPYILLTIP